MMRTILTATEAELRATGETVAYLDWLIHYDPPPIPMRNFDWHFRHKDFDGAPDGGDNRCGSAASLADCLDEIACKIEEAA